MMNIGPSKPEARRKKIGKRQKKEKKKKKTKKEKGRQTTQ